MSTDNWGICPKCKDNRLKAQDKLRAKIKAAYGKVSQEEYIELTNKISQPVDTRPTLREGYEIWTDEEGLFQVQYGCSCDRCGFKFRFNHDEMIQF